MTVHFPSDGLPPVADSDAEVCDIDLGEELCRVQADILEMGTDNYERLRRVCPDPTRRYWVLQRRVTHQVRLVLAASTPRWRASPPRRTDPAAISTAAQDVWIELDERDGSLSLVGEPAGMARTDEFSPGRPHDAERCWRCDAREAASDIGLCELCHTSLTSR